jgi:hypothetical protein
MEQRPLFKGGETVSALGFGAWPIGGGMGHVDEDVAISTVHAAIDNGLTLLDTAQGYRTSESIIGKALKNGYRDRAFIATKVSGGMSGISYSRENIMNAVENSLKAMNIDVIDLYQIHHWDDSVPIEESMGTMADLQQAGKIRHIGVSNYNADQMGQAMSAARFQTNQLRYNLFDREIEAADIPYCEREGVGILAHSPLAKGLLGGKYTVDSTFPPGDERSRFPRFQGETFARYVKATDQLKALAADKGLTLVQMAMAWLLLKPVVCSVLIGAKSPQQLEGVAAASGVTFSDDEITRIDAILATVEG